MLKEPVYTYDGLAVSFFLSVDLLNNGNLIYHFIRVRKRLFHFTAMHVDAIE